MTRRQALAKAAITTTDAAAGLLDPEQSSAFIRQAREAGPFGNAIRLEIKRASSGEINKVATGSRIIRAAVENDDDGYRVGATFPTVPYQTVKMRLPWEVTEDTYHENIEGQGFEDTMTSEMVAQFGLDWDDLDINGDTEDVGADAPFLNINDGVLKQIEVANIAGRNIDAQDINGGALHKGHFFEALYAMPNRYRSRGNLVWLMSPNRAVNWWEHLSDRATPAGDDLLTGRTQGTGGSAARGPLGVPILGSTQNGLFTPGIPQWPDSVIVLANPRNFVRVVSWQVRKRRVTGETDAQLAALDKRFYVFFVKSDVIVEEMDAVVRIFDIDAIMAGGSGSGSGS